MSSRTKNYGDFILMCMLAACNTSHPNQDYSGNIFGMSTTCQGETTRKHLVHIFLTSVDIWNTCEQAHKYTVSELVHSLLPAGPVRCLWKHAELRHCRDREPGAQGISAVNLIWLCPAGKSQCYGPKKMTGLERTLSSWGFFNAIVPFTGFFRLDVARCYWGPRMKPIDLDGRWPKRNGARSLRIKRRPLPGQDWESMGQWEFQDPKMEVMYHILGHIFWGYSLKFRPYVW